jgi:hypothetical protein
MRGMKFRPRFSLRRLFTFVVAAAVIVGLCFWCLDSPLRRSDAEIRSWLLTRTPLGSDLSRCQAVIETEGWHVHQATSMNHRITVRLGGYQGWPWYVWVDATWDFDESDQLVGIKIVRTEDAL